MPAVTRRPSVSPRHGFASLRTASIRPAKSSTEKTDPSLLKRAVALALANPYDAFKREGTDAGHAKPAAPPRTKLQTGLRFLQFFKAYVQAFAAGLASFWLLQDLMSGHFNILAFAGEHIMVFFAAPFYAVLLAPVCYGFYSALGQYRLKLEWRAYGVSCALGFADLGHRMLDGKFLLAGAFKDDAYAIGLLLCGVIAGYTFNRAAARIEVKEAEKIRS